MQTLIAAGGPSRGVAISIAGVIDPDDGRIKCANIPCIDGRTLAADLGTALGLPVWIINDADSFALAEAQAGAGRVHADNVQLMRARLPLREIHASCSEPLPAPAPQVAALGFDSGTRRRTSPTKVAALNAKLQG